MLIYRCPETGQDVRTAIVTTGDALLRMRTLQISLWCPHCLASHQVAAEDARVDGASVF